MFKLISTVCNYNYSLRFYCQRQRQVKVAIILSGCGVYDGSEIHEVSSCMIHLSRNGVKSSLFAPDIDQFHVIDHTTGNEMKEKRNVLVESARIARGKIKILENLKATEFDAIVIPGGFGVAKSLSNFAFKNVDFTLNKEVEKSIKEFVALKKPIGWVLKIIKPLL